MSFLRTLVFIFFAGKLLFAQQIYFCKSVSTDGKPIEQKNSWEIKSGSVISILLDNTKPISSSTVYMFIDRMAAGNYEAYDSKAVSAEKTDRRLIYAYSFTESGNYSVYFINNSGERLAQGTLTVRITAKPAVEKAPPTIEAEKTTYNSEIIFCEKVTNNKPVNVKERVSLKAGGAVTVFIRNEEAFNTGILVVHIHKRKNNSFDDLIQTKKFKIQANSLKTFFGYKFDSPGEYKFSVYDEYENFIKSASVLVTQ
jgi:hypothetical protein